MNGLTCVRAEKEIAFCPLKQPDTRQQQFAFDISRHQPNKPSSQSCFKKKPMSEDLGGHLNNIFESCLP